MCGAAGREAISSPSPAPKSRWVQTILQHSTGLIRGRSAILSIDEVEGPFEHRMNTFGAYERSLLCLLLNSRRWRRCCGWTAPGSASPTAADAAASPGRYGATLDPAEQIVGSGRVGTQDGLQTRARFQHWALGQPDNAHRDGCGSGAAQDCVAVSSLYEGSWVRTNHPHHDE